MKIKMRLLGADQVRAELRYGQEAVSSNARKEMHRAADRIVKQARLNAPHLEGNLEDSIRKERSTDTRGRLQLDIVAGGEVNGVNVDDYLLQMHYGSYNLGPISAAKQAALGAQAIVGPKFLDRAVNKERKTLREGLAATVSSVLNSLIRKAKKGMDR